MEPPPPNATLPGDRRFDWKRFVGAVVIGLVAFEAVARVAPRLMGWQVYPKLSRVTERCRKPVYNEGKTLTRAYNERGARGNSYAGQPIQLAVVGSSTSACSLLDQHDTWPERLREALGAERVHVDNYARDGDASAQAIAVLRGLAIEGRRYDAVVAMVHAGGGKAPPAAAAGFAGQWAPAPGALQAPSLLARRLKQQLLGEPRLMAAVDWASGLLNGGSGAAAPPLTAFSNRERRASPDVELRDVALEDDPERDAQITEQTELLIRAAQDVAEHAVFLTQPVAYDADQAPGVAERWVSLYPVAGEPGVYLSNRTIAERRRHSNRIAAATAERLGATVVDLDAAMRPLLRERADLFDDKWHLTPPGADEAGRVVAAAIEPLLTSDE